MGATDRTARAPERGAAATRATTRARPEREQMSPASTRAPSGDGRAWTRADAADGVDGVERPRSAERRRRRRPTHARPGLASTSAPSDAGSTPSSEATAMVTEPRTGLKVPAAMTPGDKALALAGRGARVKRIAGLSVKVYACGFYVDVDGARDGDAASYERLVRLVFARNVGGDKIVEALAERIRPAMDADSPALRAFEAIFDGVSFKKGTSLDFHATFEGELATFIKGKRVSVIADASLCRALFDCYVGKDPVIPELKSTVCAFVDDLN